MNAITHCPITGVKYRGSKRIAGFTGNGWGPSELTWRQSDGTYYVTGFLSLWNTRMITGPVCKTAKAAMRGYKHQRRLETQPATQGNKK